MGLYDEPVWEDPPEPTGGKRYLSVLAPLVEEPGHWARIGEYASPESAYQAMLNLRKRRYKIPEPDGMWTFRQEKHFVWAIYTQKYEES